MSGWCRSKPALARSGRAGSGQRQADDVNVEPLDGAPHGGAPTAPNVQQRHARLEVQLVQVEVDLGVLGFFERELRWLEVGTAVSSGRVLEQGEEIIGDVVVRLDVFEACPCLGWANRFLGHSRHVLLDGVSYRWLCTHSPSVARKSTWPA